MKTKEQIQSAIDDLSPSYTQGCNCGKCEVVSLALGILNWILENENDHGFDGFLAIARKINERDQLTITE